MIRRPLVVVSVLAAFAAIGIRVPQDAQAKSCSAGYVHAKLSWARSA